MDKDKLYHLIILYFFYFFLSILGTLNSELLFLSVFLTCTGQFNEGVMFIRNSVFKLTPTTRMCFLIVYNFVCVITFHRLSKGVEL